MSGQVALPSDVLKSSPSEPLGFNLSPVGECVDIRESPHSLGTNPDDLILRAPLTIRIAHIVLASAGMNEVSGVQVG
ncbi:MAG: hypothetical protein ACI841_000227 [Planctomycetota bacterium]|jgi:hypothetical protein